MQRALPQSVQSINPSASPSISGASYSASTGVLTVSTSDLAIGHSIDVSKLSLIGQGGVSYTLTTANIKTNYDAGFHIPLNEADQLNVSALLNKAGLSAVDGTSFTLSAAADWDLSAVPTAAQSSALRAANLWPPTVASASYDSSTGTLSVTGTHLVKANGALNDISAKLFTFTGKGGATYQLTDTANAEIDSTAGFKLVLSATDKAELAKILDAGGSDYKLAAADDWNTVVLGRNIGFSGKPLSVHDGAPAGPAISNARYDAASGVLTVTGSGFESGHSIDVSKLTIDGQGGRYTLTGPAITANSATSFSVVLSGDDLLHVNGLLSKNGSAALGAGFNLSAAAGWDVTSGAPADSDNRIIVSNVTPPTVTAVSYDRNSGELSFTGSGLVKFLGPENDIIPGNISFAVDGSAPVILRTTDKVDIVSATSFKLLLGAQDKVALDDYLDKAANAGTVCQITMGDGWNGFATFGDSAPKNIALNGAAAIASASYNANSGVLSVTGSGFGNTPNIDISKLSVTGEGGASYTLGSTPLTAGSATGFSVTLSAADQLAVNGLFNKNGGTAVGGASFGLSAASGWDKAGNAPADLGNSVSVSNVAAPAVTGASYDASSGILTVTGLRLVKANGALNDINAKLFTFTGKGGATYQLTDTANVEIDSATGFKLQLSAADKAALAPLFEAGGSNYQLAAADDWNTLVTGGDIGFSGKPLTVKGGAVAGPSISSASYDATTGYLQLVTSDMAAGHEIDVGKLSFTGQGGASYTLTTANVTSNYGSGIYIALNELDQLNLNGLLNKAGGSAADGQTYVLSAAAHWDRSAASAADLSTPVSLSSAATPTVSSASYDRGSGILSVSGKGMVKASGALNDITAKLFTFTGKGGATYTLTDTANAEIDSGAGFKLALSAADQAELAKILDAGGSGYQLAAADDWNTLVTGGNIGFGGKPLTVSDGAPAGPSISGARYDAASGVLTVSGSGFTPGHNIDASKLTITGQGMGGNYNTGASYTLTGPATATSGSTSFSVALSAEDQLYVNGLLNKNGSTAAAGGVGFSLSAAAGWDMNGGTPADTGNSLIVSNVTPPTITSASYDRSSGELTITGRGFVKIPGPENDVSVKELFFAVGDRMDFLSTSKNVEIISSTSLKVLVEWDDKAIIEEMLDTAASSGQVCSLLSADGWNSRVSYGDAIARTVVLYEGPVITGASYDAASGVLTVTGGGFPALAGAGNDIDVRKLSISGDGASYTLTSANVDIGSSTSFSITLNAADRAALDSRINKDGSSSAGGQAYNLAAAEGWAPGASRTAPADLSGNPITASNAGTSISGASYDAATGVLSVTGSKLGSGHSIDVSKLSVSGEGGVSYTLTSAGITTTSASGFSVTLNAADQLAVNGLLNKNGGTAASGGGFSLSAASGWDKTTSAAADTGNSVSVSNVAAPTITSASYDAATGILSVTGSRLVKADGSLNDITAKLLSFIGEGGERYTLSDTANADISSATAFSLTLSATDRAALEQLFNKNGGSATGGGSYQLAAADDWNTVVTGGDTKVAGAPLSVSGVKLPVIGSAQYDAASGILKVSGNGFSKLPGTANDIIAGKFSITGEGGVKYTLGSSANVDISSSSEFSIQLSAEDKAAVNQILNSNGSKSTGNESIGSTAYKLTAAEDWAAGADAAVNVAETAGKAITVSKVAVPTIASAKYDSSTGKLIVTGTGLLSSGGANNDIRASAFSLTGKGNAPYKLTDTADVDISSGTSFTLVLGAKDKAAVDDLLGQLGDKAGDGTVYNLAAGKGWAAGADADVNVRDETGNAIIVKHNTAPTLSRFNGAVAQSDEDQQLEISLATLQQKGDGADSDGSIAAFVVKSIGSGTLRIGANADSAQAWAAGSNDVIDANHKAFWTPAKDANGKAMGAFSVVARDDEGGESAAAVAVTVDVKPVNDAPTGSIAIEGTVTVGQTLSVKNTVADADGLGAFSYQWLADGVAIKDASGASLLLTAALQGKAITVKTTYTDKAGNAEQMLSSASAAVKPAPAPDNGNGSGNGNGPVLVDGATVHTGSSIDAKGNTTTTIRIDPVTAGRQDDNSSSNRNLADIPVAKDATGATLLEISLPQGVGVSAESTTGLTLREQLIASTSARQSEAKQLAQLISDGIDKYVPGVTDQKQVTVRGLTLNSSDSKAPGQPIVISGASGTGNGDLAHPLRQEALVIDTQKLAEGSILKLDKVEFAIVLGKATVTSGNDPLFAIGDGSSQTFLLGQGSSVQSGPLADAPTATAAVKGSTVRAGGGDDVVRASAGNDLLFGDDGNDLLYGANGDDLLNGGQGQDTLLGGKGADTAVFAGNSKDYQVTQEFGKFTVRALNGNDGSDTLINVEKIQFADKTVDISGATEAYVRIATLYQQVLHRQADFNGFQFWARLSSEGMTDGQVATNFLRAAETRTATQKDFDTMTNAGKVDFMYQMLLGREGETAGRAFWLAKLDGGMQINDAAAGFLHSAELTGQYLKPQGWDFMV
ncbi:DUF4214 domain-containing protein [Pseudoduganella violacea]|uniref:DUF4214 domain-containing protein n=1 Tax=Pseudoduganella violacea TaxID=1715466 RepID=A0A7W5B9J3_9BURK|nr:DUF4214 domain-containing protein [Pseudoduganella violacea]MBB3118871.1 hypothetical protein [Pseudoduganella violacea]